jgi:hypothetical protein
MHKIRRTHAPILQKQFSWEVKVQLKTKKCFANNFKKTFETNKKKAS